MPDRSRSDAESIAQSLMCLVAIALDKSRKYPLVIAANRDEFYRRPSARLAWWEPKDGAPAILGGRDLQSGGTWLGLTAQGRLALLTNLRDSKLTFEGAPSRGQIVPNWLSGRDPMDRFWMRTAVSGYNGFNLIAADFRDGECYWVSNNGAYPRRLERGIYGLSNGTLDAPWPKVNALKATLAQGIDGAATVDDLAAHLFKALSDPGVAADSTLPKTGIAQEQERLLSPAFIRIPEQEYGTRTSTVIITERINRHQYTHVLERSHDGTVDSPAPLRRATIKRWPPRHKSAATAPPVERAEVAEQQP